MTSSEGYVTRSDGARLFFQKVGDGPRMLLIPNGPPWVDTFARFARTHTVIFFDARNRGQSDRARDDSKSAGGIHDEVDDLDAVRNYFGIEKVDLLGHSYLGLEVILYAMTFPGHVNRVVQVCPMGPDASKQYPPELSNFDATFHDVLSKIEALRKAPPGDDPEQACRQFWSTLRELYVTNPADAGKLDGWQRCHLPNERAAGGYFNEQIFPSIRALRFTPEQMATVTMPVLTVHGTKDRSAPYGGGRDWALALPNARLVTVDGAGHMPWIEAPDRVFGAIETFLAGSWPEEAVNAR